MLAEMAKHYSDFHRADIPITYERFARIIAPAIGYAVKAMSVAAGLRFPEYRRQIWPRLQ